MLELLNLKYGFLSGDASMAQHVAGQDKLKRWIKTVIYAKLPFFVRPILYFLYRCLVDLKMLEAERWIGDKCDPAVIKSILKEKTGLLL